MRRKKECMPTDKKHYKFARLLYFQRRKSIFHMVMHITCLQETHLDENDSTLSFELNDYQLISKGRYCSNAGRLIIYIHNDFNCKHVDISSEISDSDETKPSLESIY